MIDEEFTNEEYELFLLEQQSYKEPPFNEKECIEKLRQIDARFPNAKFSVSCFKTKDEIETKMLNNTDDEIVYQCSNQYFTIKKRPNSNGIYYKDVIDALIEQNFEKKGDHRYLETIGFYINNVDKIYCSFFGS